MSRPTTPPPPGDTPAAPGQSQEQRLPVELSERFAELDDRTPVDRMQLARAMAASLQYFSASGKPEGNWSSFFPEPALAAEVFERRDGSVPPHLALFAAFLELYEHPRRVLNQLTGRHMDFHYQDVLGFRPRPALPDRAHVVLELKRGAPPVRVLESHVVTGKDARGVEQLYRPVRETVVGPAAVDRLQSTFTDPAGHGVVRCAPVAASADGLGAPLAPELPHWPPFGSASLPAGELGFALAAPVLRMREGERTVTVELTAGAGSLAGIDPGALGDALHAVLTGEKGWLGPYPVRAAIAGDVATLTVTVPAIETGAVSDYSRALHGQAFAASAPVIRFLLRPDRDLGYNELKPLVVRRARIEVDVAGITSLALENDAGSLDPKKTFLPFGPQPARGARFRIGCPEALAKTITELSVEIRWHDLPDLGELYSGYDPSGIDAGSFTATAVFHDASGTRRTVARQRLFVSASKPSTTLTLLSGGVPPPPPAPLPPAAEWLLWPRRRFDFLETRPFLTGSLLRGMPAWRLGGLRTEALSLLSRVLPPPAPVPEERSGLVTLSLDVGFYHREYRQQSIRNMLVYGKRPATASDTPVILNEPYTPAIEAIELSYRAHTRDVDIESGSPEAFANPDIAFFHVDSFGQRREHGLLRQVVSFLGDKSVPLVPGHDAEGELFLGLTGVEPGDTVSLLLQVAEGSADPSIRWPRVTWSVLCDNHWRSLDGGGLVLDTTNRLRRSGLVVVAVPREATTGNTLLPAGRLWLRTAADAGAEGVSRLLAVIANGVEVGWQDPGNDPAHLAGPLPAGRLTAWRTPIPGVKTTAQPFPSFGGRDEETAEALRTRAAERLRHKDRALTSWDYERLVLDRFPAVHTVKCIAHAASGRWIAPGQVLVVVVPDLRRRSERDPLKPGVDADTLEEIRAYLQARAGMQVTVAVENPSYQPIRLAFGVKLGRGRPFEMFRAALARELIGFLSPWAFDRERPLAFGGRVYRSVLLDFVERRDYVDYVTDFRMLSPGPTGEQDLAEVGPSRPDAILVSAPEHAIHEAD